MKKHFLFLTLILLVFASCKKDYFVDPVNPTGNGTGNGNGNGNGNGSTGCTNNAAWAKNNHHWVYEISNSFIPADTLYTTYYDAAPRIFKVIQQFDDGLLLPIDTIYTEICNNSVFTANNQAMTGKQEAYRLDGAIGEMWSNSSTSSLGNTVTNEYKITAKNVMITVPMGSFSCIEISTKSTVGTQVVTWDFYINNVKGLIKYVGTTVTYELVRTNF